MSTSCKMRFAFCKNKRTNATIIGLSGPFSTWYAFWITPSAGTWRKGRFACNSSFHKRSSCTVDFEDGACLAAAIAQRFRRTGGRSNLSWKHLPLPSVMPPNVWTTRDASSVSCTYGSHLTGYSPVAIIAGCVSRWDTVISLSTEIPITAKWKKILFRGESCLNR